MAELWVWADPHLDHPAIIGHCNRPFVGVGEMNACLLENYSDCVKSGDDVIILGDCAFRNHAHFVGMLPGKKTFVFGNHDRMPLHVLSNFTRVVGSSKCPGILEMSVGRFRICFSHYPLASWGGSFHGVWNIHGHCHGRMRECDTMLRTDAGVDLYNYSPVNFDVLRDKMESRMDAWRKAQRDRVMGDGESAFDTNKVTSGVFVDRWRQRLEADPRFFNLDYRQRYGCSDCTACSPKEHGHEDNAAGHGGNVHPEVVSHELPGVSAGE